MLKLLTAMLLLCGSSDSTVSKTSGQAALTDVYTAMTQQHIDSLPTRAAWEVQHPCTASTIIEIRRYTHSDFERDSTWYDTVCNLRFHEGVWYTNKPRVYYQALYHVKTVGTLSRKDQSTK